MESESKDFENGSSIDSIEVSASDAESAIEQGLQSLGIARENALIEILDEGSPGFLGIGGRDASVKISAKRDSEGDQKAGTKQENEVSGIGPESIGEPAAELEKPVEGQDESDQPEEERIAIGIIDQLLGKMDIEATTALRQTEPDDLTGERRWVVDVNGDDLGILIGSRGDTLNAFQYVARLMTGHQTHRRPNFLVDVEGYRERREQALARLAKRMAGKAIKRGRTVTLEPMPPNERRIIHITLRKDERVHAESTDEGRRRRVRIIPTTIISEEEDQSW